MIKTVSMAIDFRKVNDGCYQIYNGKVATSMTLDKVATGYAIRRTKRYRMPVTLFTLGKENDLTVAKERIALFIEEFINPTKRSADAIATDENFTNERSDKRNAARR